MICPACRQGLLASTDTLHMSCNWLFATEVCGLVVTHALLHVQDETQSANLRQCPELSGHFMHLLYTN